MQILFVYSGYIVREVPLNVMYLSAVARTAGHETKLFHFTPYKGVSWSRGVEERIEEGFMKELNSYDPDIVGFSLMIQNYRLTRRLSGWKRRSSMAGTWSRMAGTMRSGSRATRRPTAGSASAAGRGRIGSSSGWRGSAIYTGRRGPGRT